MTMPENKCDLDSIWAKVNPTLKEGAHPAIEYFFRALLFIFPLYTYQAAQVMGVTNKGIILGIAALGIAAFSVFRVAGSGYKGNHFSGSYAREKKLTAALFAAVMAMFAADMVLRSDRLSHSFLYVICFLVACCTAFTAESGKYYLQLFAGACTVLYLGSYRFIFKGIETIFKAERLLNTPEDSMPLFILGILAGGILYLSEENVRIRRVYLGYTAAGMVLFFLFDRSYGGFALFVFIACLFFTGDYSKEFFKRSLILTFLCAFCASNAPLLSYFSLPGLKRSYNLEGSIYIDIAMAVAALFFTTYFEKTEKEDFGDMDCRKLIGWYRRLLPILSAIMLIIVTCVISSEQIVSAVKTSGLKGISTGISKLLQERPSEAFYVVEYYKFVGVLLLAAAFALLIWVSYIILKKEQESQITKGFLVISWLFAVLWVFYPLSAMHTPMYMVFLGLAFSKGALGCQKVTSAAKAAKDDSKAAGKSAYGMILYVVGTVLFAALSLLVIVGFYRIMMPAGSAKASDPIIETEEVVRERAPIVFSIDD